MSNPITAVWRFIFRPPSVKSLLQRQLYEAEHEQLTHRASAEQMTTMAAYHTTAASMNLNRAIRLRASLADIVAAEEKARERKYPPTPARPQGVPALQDGNFRPN